MKLLCRPWVSMGILSKRPGWGSLCGLLEYGHPSWSSWKEHKAGLLVRICSFCVGTKVYNCHWTVSWEGAVSSSSFLWFSINFTENVAHLFCVNLRFFGDFFIWISTKPTLPVSMLKATHMIQSSVLLKWKVISQNVGMQFIGSHCIVQDYICLLFIQQPKWSVWS